MDTIVVWMWIACPAIGAARVAVAGPVCVQAREVDAVGIAAFGRHRVDRAIIGGELTPVRVTNDGHELAMAPVVMHDPAIGIVGMPLQHRPLLPVPGAAARQDLKVIALLQSHHPDCDAIVRPWRTVVEGRFVREQQRSRSVPGALVVIAEEVVSGAGRYRTESVTRSAEVQPTVEAGLLVAARGFHPTLEPMA